MNQKNIHFLSEDKQVAGNLLLAHDAKKNPGMLLIHGAGKSTKEKFIYLQEFLSTIGITSLAIDVRGVGESEGIFVESTLQNRIKDSVNGFTFLKDFVDNSRIGVLGTSMGGFVAAELTTKVSVRVAILCSSAAYNPQAESMLLNKSFTDILHRPESWKNSHSFTALESFSGKVLVLYGDNDIVIPDAIKQRYKSIVVKKGEYKLLPNGGHNLLFPEKQIPNGVQESAYDIIRTFLKENL